MAKRTLQFEVWEECNNHCEFCYLTKDNLYTPDQIKLRGIQNIIDSLNNKNFIKDYDAVSLIGGEFFQGQMKNPEVKAKFMEMIRLIASLQTEGYFNETWLLVTLTIGDQKDLYEVLDTVKKIYEDAKKPEILKKFWIITSYDTIGRFHSPKMEENWKFHMKNIHEKYPDIKFNTSIILTQDLIVKYLNDDFSFNDFADEFNTNFFLKQPMPAIRKELDCIKFDDLEENHMWIKRECEKILPGFLPKRSTFLEFLSKFHIDCPQYYDHLFNIKYRADDLYRNRNDETEGKLDHTHRDKDSKTEQEISPRDFISPCGHTSKYASYIDSNACMLCDKETII